MIVPLVFKRLYDGVYATPGNDIVIRRVVSRGFSGNETVWTVEILNYELPMTEMTLKDAKATAWRWLRQSAQERVDKTFEFLRKDRMNG